MTLRPASCRYCLGRPAPARRRELPAAGTTTQYAFMECAPRSGERAVWAGVGSASLGDTTW